MADHPLRTATDTPDGNVTDGGITETLYDAFQARMPLALGPTESLGDYDFSAGSPPLSVIYGATGYVYFYNADDATSPDDGLTVLVSMDGRRYILADASAIAVSSVLAIDNDPPVSPNDGDAYVVGTAPAGAWVGHAKDIALRTPRGWVFAQPQVGTALLNQETEQNIQYGPDGTWAAMNTSIGVDAVAPEQIQFWGNLSVEAQQNSPPGSPVEGEYYLVGLSPTDDWVGHENDIAYYTSTSTWAFLAAYDGAMVFNKASDITLQWFDATGDWRAPWPYQSVCDGRLTLESGVPISITDQTAKGTLYFTPFRGNNISLYVNGGWALRTFTEKSLSLAGYTSGKNYDIFAYDNSGMVAIESLVWTNDTTRATAIAYQDGIPVKSGDATRRYIGTIRTSATGQTQIKFGSLAAGGGEAFVGIWNYYNRTEVELCVQESTDSWNYASGTVRAANGSSTFRCSFVSGLAEDPVEAAYNANITGGGSGYAAIGLGLDATNAIANRMSGAVRYDANYGSVTARLAAMPQLGFHYVQALEASINAVTVTFGGDLGFTSYTKGAALLMRWRY